MSPNNSRQGQPFLQILHISDVHWVFQGKGLWPDWNAWPWCWLEANARRDASSRDRALQWAYEFVMDGVAPQQQTAPKEFHRYLREGGHRRGEWRDVPTWLVQGGDLTTFGDDRSVEAGLAFLGAVRDFVDHLVTIHGNHDVWPEKLPCCDPAGIPAKASTIPRTFAAASDPLPLAIEIPAGNARLELHTLATVCPDYFDNTLAVGRVTREELARIEAECPVAPDRFRVLLVHHPLSEPSRRFYKTIFDGERVAAALVDAADALRVHMVIAGHTHALHPKLGELPATPQAADHAPLAAGQAQLVVGSAAQHDEFKKRHPFPHQAQLLRFRATADEAGKVVVMVERVLVARRRGIGPFQHIEVSDLTEAPVQALTYALA